MASFGPFKPLFDSCSEEVVREIIEFLQIYILMVKIWIWISIYENNVQIRFELLNYDS